MDYEKYLEEFNKIYLETKDLLNKFPKEKRSEILFDKWNLKDIVSHFNHWSKHDLDCIKSLIEDKEPYWVENINKFNGEGVLSRKDKKWDEVYEEFNNLISKELFDYENLPKGLQVKRFWEDRKFTPLEFLRININHYKNDHLPKIKEHILI